MPYRIQATPQTDLPISLLDGTQRPSTKETASEANVAAPIKQVRHRASNTEVTSLVDQETNTRPRGINVSITFGGDEQVDLVDNYLHAIKDIEESGQDAAFAAMDNLTRARIRRKLKERWSTVEAPQSIERSAFYFPTDISKAATPTNSGKHACLRLSDNRAL